MNQPPRKPHHERVSAPLGTKAKSSSPPSGNQALQRQLARADRYYLQAVIRELIARAGKRSGLPYAYDWHRTAKCHFVRYADVSVYRSKQHGSCHYGGLVVCASVWGCPVCAAKIQERRKAELRQFFNWAYGNKSEAGHQRQVAMITFTFPHSIEMPLADLLKRQADAFRRMRGGNPYVKIKERAGYEGLVRGLEITRGRNGWHPHTHELFVIAADADEERFRADLLNRWWRSCLAAGLVSEDQEADFRRHAVHVVFNAKSSDYLAKLNQDGAAWGADREVAKSSTKLGRAAGKTPFQLAASDKRRDQELFLEYLTATKGRAQLFWSRGLKAKVGVDDKSDEDLALEQEDYADLLGALTLEEWMIIRHFRQRAEVLTAAEKGGWEAVQGLLAELKPRWLKAKKRASKAASGLVSQSVPTSPEPAEPSADAAGPPCAVSQVRGSADVERLLTPRSSGPQSAAWPSVRSKPPAGTGSLLDPDGLPL